MSANGTPKVYGTIGKVDSVVIPPTWENWVKAQLLLGECPLACFEPDLNTQLDFATSLVLLTDRRLLAVEGQNSAQDLRSDSANLPPRSWKLGEIRELRTREAAGLGALELLSAMALEASWPYTAA